MPLPDGRAWRATSSRAAGGDAVAPYNVGDRLPGPARYSEAADAFDARTPSSRIH